MRTLKKTNIADLIVSDIEQQVKAGLLAPGERLMSIKSLCAQYKTGQRTVERAISRLESSGRVETRRSSGVYVLKEATQLIDGKTTPHSSERTVLTIYLTDTYQAYLDLWRDLLDEATRTTGLKGFKILSARDGQIGELAKSHQLDIIQTSSVAPKNALNEKGYVWIDSLDAFGINRGDLLAPVKQLWAEEGGLPGIPFSLTLRYLLKNTGLKSSSLFNESSYTLSEFLQQVKKNGGVKPGQTESLLALEYDLIEYLTMSGGITWEGSSFSYDSMKIKNLIKHLQGSNPAIAQKRNNSPFASGTTLFQLLCSFQIHELKKQLNNLHFEAAPVPVQDGGKSLANLTLLCISRNTRNLPGCLGSIRHIMSNASQRRFASLHGNLPITESVFSHSDHVGAHPISESVMRSQLASSFLTLSEDSFYRARDNLALPLDVEGLLQGTIASEGFFSYLEFCMKALQQM
ncbi:MAG: GntR family transcriptional regulator [Planctomycetes bacterium]|nr:GntR family transcriptional regulator [Planctomycetota bacterium]